MSIIVGNSNKHLGNLQILKMQYSAIVSILPNHKYVDLGLTKGLDDDEGAKAPKNLDSDEDSYGDDSDFSDAQGLERKVIRP